jgi:amidohydrolase
MTATGAAAEHRFELLESAAKLLPEMVEIRRTIHRRPELGLRLPRTQSVVLEALDGLGFEVTTGQATTSVVAVLEGRAEGPSTLLRADMDALPMPEETGLDFASEVEGAMHACGHDAHVAMLLGAARLLAERKGELKGRVVLMFQPGEEGHAGARVMLDEGLLSEHGPIDRAFAIHVTPLAPPGLIATRPGALMASANSFELRITGKGGHASMPHDAVDPIPVACEVVTALQTMVTRRVPAFEPAVVTVAMISAGSTSNVIPEFATLLGTVRAVSDRSRVLAVDGVREVAQGIASAHRCTASYSEPSPAYPVTVNDPEAARHVLEVAKATLGDRNGSEMPTPVMGAEDWSFVLAQVKGSMAFLGVAPPGVEMPAPNHSSRMVIDEDAMPAGAAMHLAMALEP